MAMPSLPKAWRTVLLCLVLTACAAACGIKGPPVPPRQTPPEPVTDLQAVVEGETIRFDWTVEKSAASGDGALAGFFLFRWRRPLEEPDCPGCPKVFERIADVAVTSGKPVEKDRLRFTLDAPLSAGYRYSFKVIGYAAGNLRSADSNVLSFGF
jgi:predicted small lipoprotein YifL